VAKAADTPTAGDPRGWGSRPGGTPAECCEALVPGTCGDSIDCSGEETNTKAKAADTATADTPGTPAECCEAPVPGTCGDSFDCSGEAKHTQAKAADTATADTPGTSAECCEALPRCAADEYVSKKVCVSCPTGKVNAANDDASGTDTACDAKSLCMSCTKEDGYLVSEAQSTCIYNAAEKEEVCRASGLEKCALFEHEAQQHCLWSLDEVDDRSCRHCSLFGTSDAQQYCLTLHSQAYDDQNDAVTDERCTVDICMTLKPGAPRADCMYLVNTHHPMDHTCSQCPQFAEEPMDLERNIAEQCLSTARECTLQGCLSFSEGDGAAGNTQHMCFLNLDTTLNTVRDGDCASVGAGEGANP